jgi:2'-5' RNA ligase
VTLKFLGKTWPRLLEAVAEAAEAVARDSPSFESALTEIGAFPSERRARVVWAGLADPQERFARMVTRLDDLLGEYFVPETREHTPHLTVARLSPSRDLSEFASGMVGTAVASRSFAVDELVLYRSHLSPKGATYEVLGRWALGG